jgi:large subunit ribosomal protein L30
MTVSEQQRVRVHYTKSAIGYNRRQKGTIRALGLKRLGDSVEHTLSPAIAGMIRAVQHLVTVEYLDEGTDDHETT